MATRILFEDDIIAQHSLTKTVNHNINENTTIKKEVITDKAEHSSANNNSVNSEPHNTVNFENTSERTEKRISTDNSEINNTVTNSNDNCKSNYSNVVYLGSKNDNSEDTSQLVNSEDNQIIEGCPEILVEGVVTQREGNMDQDNNMGKASGSPIDRQDKSNNSKGKRKPKTELEMLGVDIKINVEDIERKYDGFGDDNQIFRTYKLRKTEQKISYKEPTDWKPERIVSTDDEPVSLVCTICFIEFDSKAALHIHMRRHNPKVLEYTCALCSQKFKTNADLIAHKSTHPSESFLCKKCKVAFSEHADYLMHKLEHSTKQYYTCPECGLNYKTNYKRHILTHFDRKASCPIRTNGELNTHRSITCVECGKIFKHKKNFEYHMSVHTGIKKYQCLYCGKCFRNNGQRLIHTRIHTNERPFPCDICGHKCKQYTDLKRHKVTHETKKKYACELCSKTYLHKDYLAIHMRSHTMQSLYKCPECDFSSVNSGGLKVHVMYKHCSERPVECTICNKSFINNNQLRKHFRSKNHKRHMYGHMMQKEEAAK